jgi:hypothetical protein
VVAFGRLLQRTVVLVPPPPGQQAPQQSLATSYRGGEISKALDEYLGSRQEVLRDDDGYVRASDLFDLCSRQRALQRQFNVVTVEQPSPSLRLMFDIGTAMHDMLRDRYLGPMQVLYGDWRCSRCRAIVTGLMPSFCSCGRRQGVFHYEERTLKNEEWKVKGHADGYVINPIRRKGVLELKSIDGKMFDALRGPLPEHVFRTVVYQWLAGVQWGVVVYASKSMRFPSVFKDFFVPYDESVITRVKATLSELRVGGQRVCGSERDKRAQRCPVARQCWANV